MINIFYWLSGLIIGGMLITLINQLSEKEAKDKYNAGYLVIYAVLTVLLVFIWLIYLISLLF